MEYEGIGDRYQQITKYARGSMPRHSLDWSAQPSLQKEYADAITTIELPPPVTTGGPPSWDVIRVRRSLRSYTREPIAVEELSQLLWATQGTTLEASGYKFRAAPSAGALYPVETYLVVNRLPGEMPAPLVAAIEKTGLALISTIPSDPAMTEFEFSGRPLVELPTETPVYQAVQKMAEQILEAG